jgi:hypothetical protein
VVGICRRFTPTHGAASSPFIWVLARKPELI